MKIYTKTGDDGSTGLYGGDRAQKNSARIHAIGEVDELNAAIGVVRAHKVSDQLDELLGKVQDWLFDIGAELACLPGGKFNFQSISAQQILLIENSIDEQTDVLPPLKYFIQPGGTIIAAELHLARCVCRRAERSVIDLHNTEPIREEVRVFLNRLSDWLFVCARTANHSQSVLDIAWRKTEPQ